MVKILVKMVAFMEKLMTPQVFAAENVVVNKLFGYYIEKKHLKLDKQYDNLFVNYDGIHIRANIRRFLPLMKRPNNLCNCSFDLFDEERRRAIIDAEDSIKEYLVNTGEYTKLLIEFDVYNKNKEYWINKYAEVKNLVGKEKFRIFKKCINEERLIAQMKSWDQVLPKYIVDWANQKFNELLQSGRFSCMDNYRVAMLGNSSQKRRYKKQVENGCCGFYDQIFDGPDGNKYKIGFNYGH